ncbi:MAG: MotA/TolQ/ExbB proton channel family protein [Gammaproteobacteria bacterium]|jgi:biopolymer transport protein ExbB|nr:MotA/TolQ/ExbB proton channel family protein [Gammaproteobacteria bacterium]
MNKKVIISAIACLMVSATAMAQEPAASLDDLLKRVEQGRVAETKEHKEREARFLSDKAGQDRLLKEARDKRTAEERRSEKLEGNFEANEVKIADLQEQLTKRLGSLKELFGVLQQVSGDTVAQFQNSLTTAQFPNSDRIEFITSLGAKMGTSSKLASIEEIERLWLELMNEMRESGRVVRFNRSVIMSTGDQVDIEMVRVGVFNLVADGKYFQYSADTGSVNELPRQPQQTRFVDSAKDLYEATSGRVAFAVDPTRGQLLSLLMDEPTFKERLDQGGTVGYVIVALGFVSFFLAMWRLIALTLMSAKVSSQLKNKTPKENNPLGRVLKVAADNADTDRETLELKLSEAIFKERPALERGLAFLKIISVVAPLMGLLGTVTGMINTFQAITLFGTGDPKLMAGGISQALVTTVEGLVVAIPTVLLHTIVSGRSRKVMYVLQEQSAGIIAERDESGASQG